MKYMAWGIAVCLLAGGAGAAAAAGASAAGVDGLISAAVAAAEGLAHKDVAEVQSDDAGVGVTDWTEGYVEVTAIGTANLALAQSKAHALSQAEETARALAYRKLAERIYGVTVNSTVTVAGAVAADDKLVAVTSGLIRDAHEVKVTHEILDDGSVLCAVTLAVPMKTARGLAGLAAQLNPATGAPLYAPAAALPAAGDYTGVVIDATGLSVNPALCPSLLTEDGRVVYGAGTLGASRVSTLGVATYAKTLEQAKEKGAGAKPLVIQALKAVGEYACDLVLPGPLVDALFALQTEKNVVDGGHVIILTRGVE